MCGLSPLLQITQGAQLFVGWWLRFLYIRGEANRPAGCCDDLFACHAGVNVHHNQFVCWRLRLHDTEICDNCHWTLARQT